MPIKWNPDTDQLLLLKILETHELKVDAKKISTAWPTDKGEAPTARAITERLVKIRTNAVKNGLGNFTISSSQTGTAPVSAATPRKDPSDVPATPTKTPSKPPSKTPSKTAAKTPSTTTTTPKGAAARANVHPSTEEDTSASPTPAAPKSANKKTSPTKRKHDAVIKPEPDDDEFIQPQPTTPHHNQASPGAFRQPTVNVYGLADVARDRQAAGLTPTNKPQNLTLRQNDGAADAAGSPTKRIKRSASRRASYADEDDAGADSDASAYEDDEVAV